jgi:hypothetical protein
VHAEFDFVSASDGSKHTVSTFGEAMDSGDKATNKAMSAAYKYAAFQAFAIPTEGDNDPDNSTHEVKAKLPEDIRVSPLHGAGDSLTAEKRAELDEISLYIIESHQAGKSTDAIRVYYEIKDNEEKVYVWKNLAAQSALRALIKANNPNPPHTATAKPSETEPIK